ncbi:putative DNA-binding protein [Desemzia incerta]|uniref:putative DNA-binding protein n=1 Tax=Desemzia incerta TaxID=82801 RepID=UPI0033148765
MELEKTNQMNALFDFYGALLTVKQQEYMQLYYGDDFSLGEIADEFNVSRQAIYDNIKRTEKILIEYEEKLNLFKKFSETNAIIDQLEEYVTAHYPKDTAFKAELEKLRQTNDEE